MRAINTLSLFVQRRHGCCTACLRTASVASSRDRTDLAKTAAPEALLVFRGGRTHPCALRANLNPDQPEHVASSAQPERSLHCHD